MPWKLLAILLTIMVSGHAATAQKTNEERVMANVAWLSGAYLFSIHTGLKSVTANEAELFDQTIGRTSWRMQAKRVSDCEYVAIAAPEADRPSSVSINFSKLSDVAFRSGPWFVVAGRDGAVCERRPGKAAAKCSNNLAIEANGAAEKMLETVRFIKANACQGYASGKFGPRY